MDKSKQIGNSGMDESTKKLMKKKQGFIQLLILGAATIVLVAGVFIYKTINNEPDILGAIPSTVSSSTTINTLYTEVNNLVGFVRSSTSTLGVFGTLSTTTGNLIVASTSGGWTVLDVGTNAYVLTASSTAQSGVSWEATTGLTGSGSANEFLLWNTTTNAMGSANATFVTSTGLMTFTATTTITNLLSTSGTVTGLWNTNFNSVSSTITNVRFTNASGTNMTLTGDIVSANSLFTTVSSTRLQLTGEIDVAGRTDLTVVSSTNQTASGRIDTDSLSVNNNLVLSTSSRAFALVDTNTSTYKFGFALSASAVTITEITCIVDQTTGSDEQTVYIWEASGVTTSSIDASVSPITCDADGAVDDGSLTDASIAANNRLFVHSLAGTASGTPNFVTVEIYFKH